MENGDLKTRLEELELDDLVIEEIMSKLNSDEVGIAGSNVNEVIEELKERIRNEKDWRKKASLSAKIISLGLE